MKKSDTSFHELIVLSYYGELSAEQKRVLDDALASQPELAQTAAKLSESLSFMKNSSASEAVEPDAAKLSRIENSILNATVRAPKVAPHFEEQRTHRTLIQTIRELFMSPQAIGFALAGGLAFLVIGIYIGSQIQPQPHVVSMAAVTPGDTAVVPTPVIAGSRQVSDFLRRSQIYLATAVDNEVACEKCLPIQQQLPNRQIAKDLLKEASALKDKSKGNPEIEKLLTDIEFVLNNIGNNADISPSQAEEVHHIASNAVCEVAERIDSVNHQHQALQKQTGH